MTFRTPLAIAVLAAAVVTLPAIAAPGHRGSHATRGQVQEQAREGISRQGHTQSPEHAGGCAGYTSKTGNRISHCSAGEERYVPDIQSAGSEDLAKAKELHSAALGFCRSHSSLDSLSRDGYRPTRPGMTHWFNPQLGRDFDAHKPRFAVVKDGKLVGVLYLSPQLPSLGSIPRAHSHHPGREMLHVWCSDDMERAFATKDPDSGKA
jgi:hypothetical protein